MEYGEIEALRAVLINHPPFAVDSGGPLWELSSRNAKIEFVGQDRNEFRVFEPTGSSQVQFDKSGLVFYSRERKGAGTVFAFPDSIQRRGVSPKLC